jgi:hypothetical protein
MKVFQRTQEEVLDSMHYGRLYRIARIHGNAFVAFRVRRKANNLYAIKSERITILKKEGSALIPEVGDLAFIDNGKNATWSLFKISYE